MSAYYFYLNLAAFIGNNSPAWPSLSQVQKRKAFTKKGINFYLSICDLWVGKGNTIKKKTKSVYTNYQSDFNTYAE